MNHRVNERKPNITTNQISSFLFSSIGSKPFQDRVTLRGAAVEERLWLTIGKPAFEKSYKLTLKIQQFYQMHKKPNFHNNGLFTREQNQYRKMKMTIINLRLFKQSPFIKKNSEEMQLTPLIKCRIITSSKVVSQHPPP